MPFIGVLAKPWGWRATFIAPTKTQKPFPFTIQRTTLPQSRPLGVPAPSEREPGMGTYHFIGVLAKIRGCGRFSSPLRKLRNRFLLPFIGRHSLSHARWACQLPQRGSRGWAVPFNWVLAKILRYGRFSSPLRKLRNRFLLPFNGGHSLSHALWACQLPQGGSRGGLYHSSGCSLKSGGTGDFHRPYGGSEGITLYHGKSPGRRGSGDWGVSPGLGLRWTGPIPRGFWGRRR